MQSCFWRLPPILLVLAAVVCFHAQLVAQSPLPPQQGGPQPSPDEFRWGLVNQEGEELLPPKYDHFWRLTPHLWAVQQGRKIGLLTNHGEWVEKMGLDSVARWHNQLVYSRAGSSVQLWDSTGAPLLPELCNELNWLRPDAYTFRLGLKLGLLDTTGQVLFPAEYRGFQDLHHTYLGVKRDSLWAIYNARGDQQLYDYLLDRVLPFRPGLFRIVLHGRWGLFASNKRIQLYNHLEYIDWCKQGLAYTRADDRWGLLDSVGNELVKPRFDYIASFRGQVAQVRVGDQWGAINRKGEVVLDITRPSPPRLNSEGLLIDEKPCEQASGQVLCVENDPGRKGCVLWGLQEMNGAVRAPTKYCYLREIQHGYTLIGQDKSRVLGTKPFEGIKWGLLTNQGEQILAPRYEQVRPVSPDVIIIRQNGKMGFVDAEGNILTPPTYDYIGSYHKGFATARLNGKMGLVSRQGEEVVAPEYDTLAPVTPDLLKARKLNHWSLYSAWGVKRSNKRYEEIGQAQEGRIPVMQARKWGFIDLNGQEVIERKYDEVSPFQYGKTVARQGRTWLVLNTEGEVLHQGDYERALLVASDYLGVRRDRQWGVLRISTGAEVIPFKYSGLEPLNEAVVALRDGPDWGWGTLPEGKTVNTRYRKLTPLNGPFVGVKPEYHWAVFSAAGKRLTKRDFDLVAPYSRQAFRVGLEP